jgi:hypothetical protein
MVVKNCIINNYISRDIEYKEILSNLKKQNSNIIILNKNKVINFLDEGKIFLYPSYRKYDSDEILLCDANSILVGIRYKDFFCLLTNDIPNYELNNLISQYFISNKTTIFLVSRNEHFKNNLNPKITIVSNGFKPFKEIKKVPIYFLDETDVEIIYNNSKISKITNDKDKIKIFFNK